MSNMASQPSQSLFKIWTLSWNSRQPWRSQEVCIFILNISNKEWDIMLMMSGNADEVGHQSQESWWGLKGHEWYHGTGMGQNKFKMTYIRGVKCYPHMYRILPYVQKVFWFHSNFPDLQIQCFSPTPNLPNLSALCPSLIFHKLNNPNFYTNKSPPLQSNSFLCRFWQCSGKRAHLENATTLPVFMICLSVACTSRSTVCMLVKTTMATAQIST